MLNFNQDAAEEGKVVAAFAKANHATEHVVLADLLVGLVHFLNIEFLGDSDQGFENTGSQGILHPSQVHCVDLWEELKQIFVVALVLYIVFLEHWCATCTSSSFMSQAVLLPLHKLVFERDKEEAIAADHIFHVLFFFCHHLKPLEPFRSDVVTCDLHCYLIV